jgi:hypothetical protein
MAPGSFPREDESMYSEVIGQVVAYDLALRVDTESAGVGCAWKVK